MKQVKALAPMTTLLLLLTLCACGGVRNNAEELALDIRTSLLEADTLDLTADVTADYGERVYDFTVRFTGDADKGAMEILAPEEIAGLKARIDLSGATLEYDGAELDTGALTADGLSPAEAIPVLISQWQSGFISGCSFEKLDEAETLTVTTDVSETVTSKTWFDVKTRLPLRSELSDNGRMAVTVRFDSATIT